MLFRLVRPMRHKGSRNVYFQQRIPADVKHRLATIGRRRVLEFRFVATDAVDGSDGKTVSVAVTGRSSSIKFSLHTSDPTEVKVRQAEAARQAELHWTALRQINAVTLSHRQCVALSGKAYQA
jgi:hypothetical protein